MRRALFLLLIAGGLGLWSWGAAAEPLAPVRVIVTFHQPPGASQRMLVRDLGGVVLHSYDIVPAVAAELPPSAVASLRTAPGVAMVEEDQPVYALDTELDDSWGVKRIGAGEVHPTNSGEGIRVAVLDTGIDYGHPDLDDNYAGGWDFVNNDSDPFDDHYHGTMVAGVVAAEDNGSGVVGVAPRAELYALKVLNHEGVGSTIHIMQALDWAVLHDMDVVNMSFGVDEYVSAFEATIRDAYEAGIVLVAAAGNANPCYGDPATDNVRYPARFDEVMAVAATDQSDTRACFSSTGPAVELTAPGLMVWTTTYPGGGYWYGTGTSIASPHVAGAAALALASGMSYDDVRPWLQGTADDLGTPGRDTWYGFGLVNVRSLLSSGVDSDGDGFTDATEIYLGTDPFDSCPDDPSDSAWPLDINMDTWANVVDILMYPVNVSMPAEQGVEPTYNARYDLNTDSWVNVTDILLFPVKADMPLQCTNP